MRSEGIDCATRDERLTRPEVALAISGQLRDGQAVDVHPMAEHEAGVLWCATAFGKTVVAAPLITVRKVSTLVLVYRRELASQWRERLGTMLEPLTRIGTIGGVRPRPTHLLDVSTMQSLVRHGEVDLAVREYGHAVVNAEWHATERARLSASGRAPPSVDCQIAAIAWPHALTLVTRNVTDFADFKGVRLERWG
ncbi:MAG: hypothetical protein H6983_17870 [Ectothiorhodospiraceae bacterium]|nr:hypothetical protein [Ectothiorhodospiraceae bacterium]